MSVMSQTQLLIGTVVLASSAVAFFVTPWALGVTAFFGCGLIMAGLTGQCPMANAIARLPWNRGDACKACS